MIPLMVIRFVGLNISSDLFKSEIVWDKILVSFWCLQFSITTQ